MQLFAFGSLPYILILMTFFVQREQYRDPPETDPSPQDPSDRPLPRTLFCPFFLSIMLLLSVASVAVPLAKTSVASRDDDFLAVLGVGPGSGGNNFGHLFSVHYVYTCIANAAVSIAVLVRIFCWSGIPGRKAATLYYVVLLVPACSPCTTGRRTSSRASSSAAFCSSSASGSLRAHLASQVFAVVAMVQGAAAITLVLVTGLAMRSEAKSPLPLGILFAASLMIFLTITGAKAVTESPANG
ncbi:hypothetical protein CDEST_13999 [Colletotrichum destructivum]|uniref:Uncharacterized protein n=1 Tax=Colletotrichum destructivum TaxID=34406 RepID=A0AAX4J0R1_9PEZI|nr:hypothetical protein CDEST_13999 [Colletotrichum destructivum]